MAEDYATYYTRAGLGVSSLAEITDATSISPTTGTICDKEYWEDHAYDQIRQLYLTLGAAPGSGVTGNFTVNNANTTNNGEDSYLYFDRGTNYTYGDAYLKWDHTNNYFQFNDDLTGAVGSTLGTSGRPWAKGWLTALDVAGVATLGSIVTTGTVTAGATTVDSLSVTGTLSTGGLDFEGRTLKLNSDATAGETTVIEVYRGSDHSDDADDPAYLRWNEGDSQWEIRAPDAQHRAIVGVGDAGVITTAMLSSAVYAGTGSLTTIARSDHTHTGGTLAASGTENTTFELDSDWASENVDVGLLFGGATWYLQLNPSEGASAYFEFSHAIAPATEGAGFSLGKDAQRWDDLFLGGDADIEGDLQLDGTATIGAIGGDLSVYGQYVTVNADLLDDDVLGGLRLLLADDTSYAEIYYDGTKWQSRNGGGTYIDLATISGTQTLTNKTLTDPVLSGSFTGSLSTDGNYINLDAGDDGSAGTEFGYLRLNHGGGVALLGWNGSVWRLNNGSGFLTLATLTGSETFTNKTLTSPILDGGTWNNNPTFPGNPTFTANPSFSGSPVFTVTSAKKPNFSVGTVVTAPFSVSLAAGYDPVTVTDLSADQVDGIEVSEILHAPAVGGNYEMTTNLDLNGHDLLNFSYVADAHASGHMSGGADELTSVFGSGVDGTNSSTWTLGPTAAATTSHRVTLGMGSDFYMGVLTASGTKKLGLAGSGVHACPGAADASQDLGWDGARWQRGWFSQQINLKPISTEAPVDKVENGTIWMVAGPVGAEYPSALKTQIDSTIMTILDEDNKTGAIGTTGAWGVTGALTVGTTGTFGGGVTVPSGYGLGVNGAGIFDGITRDASALYLYRTGIAELTVTNASAAFASDVSVAGVLEVTGGGAFGGNVSISTGYGVNLNGGGTTWTGVLSYVSALRFFYENVNELTITNANAAFTHDVSLETNSKLRFDGSAGNEYMYASGSYLYTVVGAVNYLAQGGNANYFYNHVRVQENYRLYFDWNSDTYMSFDGTSLHLYLNGTLRRTWSP